MKYRQKTGNKIIIACMDAGKGRELGCGSFTCMDAGKGRKLYLYPYSLYFKRREVLIEHMFYKIRAL